MDQESNGSDPIRDSRPFVRMGLVLGGLALTALIVLSNTGHRSSPASVFSKDIRPRLVAERGQLTVTSTAFWASTGSALRCNGRRCAKARRWTCRPHVGVIPL